MLKIVETVILMSRWLQLPFLLGLIVVLGLLGIEFAERLLDTAQRIAVLTKEETILVALDLIDMVLIANLVVIVIISGYEIFVSRPHVKLGTDLPGWVGRIEATTLKSSIAGVILLISAIHLLNVFMTDKELSNPLMLKYIALHILFLVTALAFMLSERMQRGQTSTLKRSPYAEASEPQAKRDKEA